ncbi:MAG: hypothetical protein AAFU61_06120 [Pseudomonadota bacterium]
MRDCERPLATLRRLGLAMVAALSVAIGSAGGAVAQSEGDVSFGRLLADGFDIKTAERNGAVTDLMLQRETIAFHCRLPMAGDAEARAQTPCQPLAPSTYARETAAAEATATRARAEQAAARQREAELERERAIAAAAPSPGDAPKNAEDAIMLHFMASDCTITIPQSVAPPQAGPYFLGPYEARYPDADIGFLVERMLEEGRAAFGPDGADFVFTLTGVGPCP